MIRITGTVEGMAVFDRAFLKVEAILNDFSPVFEDGGALILEWNQDQFQSAGAKGGTPWKPLSEAYSEWKAANTNWGSLVDISILRLSDKMMKSLTIKGAEGNVWDIGKTEATFGSTNPLAGYHHRGEGNLPAREIIVVNASRKTQMMKRAQAVLIEEIRKGAGGLVQRTEEF